MSDRPSPLTALGSAVPGLPPGSVVSRPVRRRLRRARMEPLLWLSDRPVDAPASAYPAPAGFQAVLLHDRPHLEEWWNTDALDPARASDPDGHHAEPVLREYWSAVIPEPEEGEERENEELITPFGPAWPGLAAAGTPVRDPETAAAELAASCMREGWFGRPRLALVPARRGADVPAALGWGGPLNHESDTARISAVLRSWEDRFGARILALGFDRLDLHVAAPPRTTAEALPVAAEHFAFCPDNVWQGSGTVRDYAEEALTGNDHWSFWWD